VLLAVVLIVLSIWYIRRRMKKERQFNQGKNRQFIKLDFSS
jgi:flagellar biogenesis protein FliO